MAEKQVWKRSGVTPPEAVMVMTRWTKLTVLHIGNARSVRRRPPRFWDPRRRGPAPEFKDATAWFGLVRLTSYHAQQRKAQPESIIVLVST